MVFHYADLLLCFNSLKTLTIETLLIIFTSIAIVLGICGIIFIPWKITYSSMEVLFIIGLILMILSIVVIIIIFYTRIRGKSRKNIIRILIVSTIIIVFICFLALILFVIISFITISDLNNKETTRIEEIYEQTGEIKNVTIIENDLTSKSKRLFSIISLTVTIAIIIFLIFLWISEYLRLIYGTNLSYNEYVRREKASVLKHPTKNGLLVVGHDKYGFPIFGKQRGNKFIITGSKSKFEEKIKTQSREFFNKDGKINFRYYEKYPEKPMEQINGNQKGDITEKEKYIEKYFDGEDMFPDYNNFFNNTILNYEDNNNSINP